MPPETKRKAKRSQEKNIQNGSKFGQNDFYKYDTGPLCLNNKFSREEAVAALHTEWTAPGTKGTYTAALPLYQRAYKAGPGQWPLTVRPLEVFAGDLQVSPSTKGRPFTFGPWSTRPVSAERAPTWTPSGSRPRCAWKGASPRRCRLSPSRSRSCGPGPEAAGYSGQE